MTRSLRSAEVEEPLEDFDRAMIGKNSKRLKLCLELLVSERKEWKYVSYRAWKFHAQYGKSVMEG